MKISLNGTDFRLNKNTCNKRQYANLTPLKADTVSFGALKKTNFSSFDLFAVNKFKAPIEKFNSNEDLQNWCRTKIQQEYLSKTDKMCKSYDKQAEIQKREILKKWISYLTVENTALTPSIQLVILSSITSELNPKTNRLPLHLNKRVVADTLFEAEQNFKNNKNYQFNFNKAYKNKLFAQAIGDNKAVNGEYTGWTIIPSKDHDNKNFASNVERLQTLSHDSWCTKTYNAEPYLSEGDFHIYFEQGHPKLGIRFVGDSIAEVQGEKNDSLIPAQYQSILLEKFDYGTFSSDALDQLYDSGDLKAKAYKFFPNGVENYTKAAILTKFGMEVKKDENNMLILKEYHEPVEYSKISDENEPINLEEMGIDINELLSDVVEIEGEADFSDSSVASLKNLRKIGQNAKFSYSNEIDLSALEYIGNDAEFYRSEISKLPKLRFIGGNADFEESKIVALGNLKIMRDANFKNAKMLKVLKNVSVEKDLYIDNAGILSGVKEVKGSIHIKNRTFDGKIARYIAIIKKAINRKFTFLEARIIAENGLTDAQIKIYDKYVTQEGMNPEEAAYEASFSCY